MSKDMLLESGVLKAEDLVDVQAADASVLKRVHDAEYLAKIYNSQLDRKEQIKLGLPASPKLYHRSGTEVEATRLACRAALEEGAAAVLAGGTHHAFREHGEGFCVFNDVAIAIKDLQIWKPGIKVMIVDTDAHQGNGTHSLLKDDPNVFCYSIHVGRNYPTKKVEGNMDVETVRYVEGPMYLQQLFATLADALESFTPDLVIWISGADNHRNDKFGQMMLSLADMQARDETILKAFMANRIPIVTLYGGGYNRELVNTAKIHRATITTAKRLADRYLRK